MTADWISRPSGAPQTDLADVYLRPTRKGSEASGVAPYGTRSRRYNVQSPHCYTSLSTGRKHMHETPITNEESHRNRGPPKPDTAGSVSPSTGTPAEIRICPIRHSCSAEPGQGTGGAKARAAEGPPPPLKPRARPFWSKSPPPIGLAPGSPKMTGR
jgi:hypothetical protein